MTAVGAILRYSHIEPIFENSSHGKPPSVRPASSLATDLFIVLPSHHIWAPHTRQRAVFSTSSRSRASTTLVVDHRCPKGCSRHPSYFEGIHVPLLRKVGDYSVSRAITNEKWEALSPSSSSSFESLDPLPRGTKHVRRFHSIVVTAS